MTSISATPFPAPARPAPSGAVTTTSPADPEVHDLHGQATTEPGAVREGIVPATIALLTVLGVLTGLAALAALAVRAVAGLAAGIG